jgi:hypothetical protein
MFLCPTAVDATDRARFATPTAVEDIPMTAFTACGSPAITPVKVVRFPGKATLFITPTATDESEVAEEKFERPIQTELLPPRVATFAYPNVEELSAAEVLELPTAVANPVLAVFPAPTATAETPLAVLLDPTAVASEPVLAVLNRPTAVELSDEAVFERPTAVV